MIPIATAITTIAPPAMPRISPKFELLSGFGLGLGSGFGFTIQVILFVYVVKRSCVEFVVDFTVMVAEMVFVSFTPVKLFVQLRYLLGVKQATLGQAITYSSFCRGLQSCCA
jgi:hypothetical protein